MRILGLFLLSLWTVACGPPHSVDRAAPVGDGGIAPPRNPRGPGQGPSPERSPTLTGGRCQAGTECRSGYCVDGICCESACMGPCQACDVAESAGRCLPVPDGQDPDDDCKEDPASSCGRDGACDGKGACRQYPAGTECGPGGCSVATQSAARTCDGQGICQPGATKSCAPAVCIEDTCGDPCAADPDCMTGFYCDGGTCRTRREQAATCERDAQCASGHCADKVCCATACADKCYTCDATGSVGTCTPVRDGGDPRQECPVQVTQSCGNAGGCNGRGACRLHVQGAPCGFASCTGSTVTGAHTCDGMGTCKPGPKKDCSPFVCNGDGCWTVCATNDQCKAPRTCRTATYTCQ
jgi:hypothetical protein